MTQYEMVELLREKTQVTYEEGKRALEATNWDLLEAIVLLEREGKTGKKSANYSTKPNEEPNQEPPRPSALRENLGKLWRWICRLIDIGNKNFFIVKKKNDEAFRLSITAFVAILCISLPVSIGLLLLGLLTGFRYSVAGSNVNTGAVNNIMDKVNNAAENIVSSFDDNKSTAADSEQGREDK